MCFLYLLANDDVAQPGHNKHFAFPLELDINEASAHYYHLIVNFAIICFLTSSLHTSAPQITLARPTRLSFSIFSSFKMAIHSQKRPQSLRSQSTFIRSMCAPLELNQFVSVFRNFTIRTAVEAPHNLIQFQDVHSSGSGVLCSSLSIQFYASDHFYGAFLRLPNFRQCNCICFLFLAREKLNLFHFICALDSSL